MSKTTHNPFLASKRKEGQEKDKGGGTTPAAKDITYTPTYVSQANANRPNPPRSKVPYHTPVREVRSASGEVCSTLVPQIGYLGSGICKTTQSHHHSPGCNSVTRLHPELGLVGEVRDLPLTHTAAPPR